MMAGAQISFEVAILATIFGVAMGVLLGMIAGFYGGVVDMFVSRATELVMALPLLLFAIAFSFTVGQRLNAYTFFGLFSPGVVTLVIVISVFSWFYPARIIRAQVLSLREKEFVEAAKMVGASNRRILRSHLLPHLTGTIIVYSTLLVATNILFEAGLSFLGVGIPQGEPSWGNLINSAVNYYISIPWLMVWPGLGILFATLAFNLLGDGARRARSARHVLPAPASHLTLRPLSSTDMDRWVSVPSSPGNATGGNRMRRPGMWIALGAVTLGVVLFGASGCGSSSSSGGASTVSTGASVNSRQAGRHDQGRVARRHRLHRPRPRLLPGVLADRVCDVRQLLLPDKAALGLPAAAGGGVRDADRLV